ncbi:PilZ domain-containing protein [Campylobacter sp. RM16188]|uniref:PilZ domain-containing protein n=1 Tax=Campylobacter sp. RM16188 TaxID=1705725 RepID=UPI0015545E9F|nr:PilZ domain-containing protein [Campylobacter sp. RM16188]
MNKGVKNSNSIILKRAIDVFEKALNDGHSVHFLNLYNGVKVECLGKILSVENDTVVCETTLLQILAMKEERNAYIVTDLFFAQNLKADIVSFDISNLTVTLRNFIYMNNLHANLRQFQRVYPNRFTKVVLEQGEIQVKGNLYDISEGGIGVVSADCAPFDKKKPIIAQFELEFNSTKEIVSIEVQMKLLADLVYRGAVRYCCQILSGQPRQADIARFTKERVKETIEELKEQLSLYN